MRPWFFVAVTLFVVGVVLACLHWAGVGYLMPWAYAAATFGVGLGITIWITQLGNWGVPGDEPPIFRRAKI